VFNECGSFNDRREVTGEDWECRQQKSFSFAVFFGDLWNGRGTID
jgi:hypothetical protein